MDLNLSSKRARQLNKLELETKGPVVYWMSRDQRSNDNWALLYSQHKAKETKQPLIVVFCLQTSFLNASPKHYNFMLTGLEEVEANLEKLNIPFVLLEGKPQEAIPEFVEKQNAMLLVTDFSPLKIKKEWNDKLIQKLEIPFVEVDAHNLIPVWKASDKQEFAAYTFRPKIHNNFDSYLNDFPELKAQQTNLKFPKINWNKLKAVLKIKDSDTYDWIIPGEKAARKAALNFLKADIHNYNAKRNDPSENAQSNLSPYLHYGQLSAQRIVLELFKLNQNLHKLFKQSKESNEAAFLEELIVRRELSDNFCYYNSNYDNPKCFPQWAKDSLKEHSADKRGFLYSLHEFEEAKTHDELWNAAQLEMVHHGKMHGYMRMYWAKKILEWTKSPEEAMEFAIYLNDKYELDGRDPNGYTGIAWSIGGIHDRAWTDRKIFGKIRYMNYNGCKRKFNVEKYIEKVANLKFKDF